MKNTEWPKDEIRRVARSSGKPLEVICAQAFLAAGWKARLGAHFADGALDVVRELDVLAEREWELTPDITVRVRALVSCRGFPAERSPLVYSVSQSSVPSFTPTVLSSHRSRQPWAGRDRTSGPLAELESRAAAKLLEASQLAGSRPVVAFDMIERTEPAAKNPNKPPPPVSYSRSREGDRLLFEAVDSAVRAAFFWTQENYQLEKPLCFAALSVPVCVLSIPFWDICIDGGTIAEPEVQHRGYQSHAYPARPSSKEVMALLWSVDSIADLIAALDFLFLWFREEVTLMVGGTAR